VSQADFVIVAGPNGAGKSTYCTDNKLSLLSEFGIPSFDLDHTFADLYNSFSNVMDEQLEYNLLEKAKEDFESEAFNALKSKTNFSFQTNFDKSYTDSWRLKFERAKFKTHLIFLFVQNKKTCFARVDKRVKEGGHFVPKDVISHRYDAGLHNLNQYHLLYNTVKIIDTTGHSNLLLYKRIENELRYVHEDFAEVIVKKKLNNFLSDL
jgi:predicted ABC-type ATPase